MSSNLPRVIQKARWHLHTQWREILSLGNRFFLMNSKCACALLQRQALSLSSKVYDTAILEKIVWNKGCQCLYLQDLQNSQRPGRMAPSHSISTKVKEADVYCLLVMHQPLTRRLLIPYLIKAQRLYCCFISKEAGE